MSSKPISEVPINTLIKAIRNLHGCEALWVESVPVTETFQGKTVWEGVVQVFELSGHPTASRCYAWSYVTDQKTGKRKFFAVLHQDPVDSPQAAVRAAIVAEYRKEEMKTVLIFEKKKVMANADWKELELGATAMLSRAENGWAQIDLPNMGPLLFQYDDAAYDALERNGFFLTPESAMSAIIRDSKGSLSNDFKRFLPRKS